VTAELVQASSPRASTMDFNEFVRCMKALKLIPAPLTVRCPYCYPAAGNAASEQSAAVMNRCNARAPACQWLRPTFMSVP
jgi:hypothetical protein